MKLLGTLLLFTVASIFMYGQQSQSSANTSEAPGSVPKQSPMNDQPFLRGSFDHPPSPAQAQGVNQAHDLERQLNGLTNSLGNVRGVIEIPSTAPQGWPERPATSNIRYIDDRGNSLPDMWGKPSSRASGGVKGGWNNALLIRATETDAAPQNQYTGFMNMQFHYTAAKGGINNHTSKGGTKTDYFNVLATSEMRTVGQKTGIASYLASFSGGDTMGIQSYVTQYGGFDTGGDEQTEGIRIQEQQGSASSGNSGGIFAGVASVISGTTLTYKPGHDEKTIGEGRLIRDLDQVYRTGSIASIHASGESPNTITITGNGTHWSELGKRAHTEWNDLAGGGGVVSTNLAFCFEPLKNDGYDTCFPVSAIADDTHLTVNLLGAGTSMNTSWPREWPVTGGYQIYGAAWPTSVDNLAHTFTAADLSGIASGHRIDQVLAYNTEITGQLVHISRHIGIPERGGGINIMNGGTANSPSMQFGVSVSGGFQSAIAFQYSQQKSGVPAYFGKLYNDPTSKTLFDSTTVRTPAQEVSLWRLRDTSGANHAMLTFLRDSATACVLDASLCVSASGAVAVTQLGQAATNDYAGTITISGTDSSSVNFRQPFKSAPVCTLTPTSDPTALGAYWVATTPASITANVKRNGTISFNYTCVGNPS